MTRRAFIQKGLCVGALLVTRPALSLGTGPVMVRVTLDQTLAYTSQVVAQRYLADLALALGETARILDGIQAATLPAQTTRQVLDIVISSFWRVGSGLSAWLGPQAPPPKEQWLGILNEAPLCIGVNRFMPQNWQALAGSANHPQGPIRCGLPSGDPSIHRLAQALLAKAGCSVDKYVGFAGGHHLLPALVGARLDVAMAPMDSHDFWGSPGSYADAQKFHRRGDVRWLAVANAQGLRDHPEIPTLNQIFGHAGHEAVLTTLISSQGEGDPEWMERLQRAASPRMTDDFSATDWKRQRTGG